MKSAGGSGRRPSLLKELRVDDRLGTPTVILEFAVDISIGLGKETTKRNSLFRAY
jgi:hypothetical protein